MMTTVELSGLCHHLSPHSAPTKLHGIYYAMDIDTSHASTDNTMENAMVSITMSDVGISSLDKTKPITRKARPTVRKQQRSRLVLRRAVARLASEAKQTALLTLRHESPMPWTLTRWIWGKWIWRTWIPCGNYQPLATVTSTSYVIQ